MHYNQGDIGKNLCDRHSMQYYSLIKFYMNHFIAFNLLIAHLEVIFSDKIIYRPESYLITL